MLGSKHIWKDMLLENDEFNIFSEFMVLYISELASIWRHTTSGYMIGKVGNYLLTEDDFRTLSGTTWLNDKVRNSIHVKYLHVSRTHNDCLLTSIHVQ